LIITIIILRIKKTIHIAADNDEAGKKGERID
jgi:hypothetical protein